MSKKRLFVVIIIVFLFVISIYASSQYYKGKYVISFETGTDEEILNKYVDRNSKVTVPKEPSKDGYVFVEWQYEGEKFDFDTEIKKNIVLSAKWKKLDYITISFDTGTDYKIDDVKIIKGSKVDELKTPQKQGYEFIGWYLNDTLYEDQEIYEDSTLTAKYKIIMPDFKVGDIVTITNCYYDSIISTDCKYNVAIGWKRKILEIYEGSLNPYMLGDETGVTGFFKAESIKKG